MTTINRHVKDLKGAIAAINKLAAILRKIEGRRDKPSLDLSDTWKVKINGVSFDKDYMNEFLTEWGRDENNARIIVDAFTEWLGAKIKEFGHVLTTAEGEAVSQNEAAGTPIKEESDAAGGGDTHGD